jgi:hypothetical protein
MEIAIALDCYDDIFSDFDIRSYRERALSRDFLDELHIRLRKRGTEGRVEIVLLVPAGERRQTDERLILERMQGFFEERHAYYARQNRGNRFRSILYIAAGLALSLVANLIQRRLTSFPLFSDFLLIPAWFFVWNGLELFLKNRKEAAGKEAYYAALSSAKKAFRDMEE